MKDINIKILLPIVIVFFLIVGTCYPDSLFLQNALGTSLLIASLYFVGCFISESKCK